MCCARSATARWRPVRVPSEQELVNEFGVARMTVNRALRELAEQGVIVRVAGVGSFVAEEKPQSTLLRIANIGEEITQRGHDHRFELLDMRRESASPEVAAALDLAVGASVFHLHGVHFENELPVQIEDRYVNPAWSPTSWTRISLPCSPRSIWCAMCSTTRSNMWSMPSCRRPSRPGCCRWLSTSLA
jgi:histidine utilization repressor